MISISTTTRTNARIKVILSYPWTFFNPSSISTSKLVVSADSDFPAESLIPPIISKIDERYENEVDIVFKQPLK